MKAREREDLLQLLQKRFEKNLFRHKSISWSEVLGRTQGNSAALESLREMETTGGEPDVMGRDITTGHVHFCDCAAESPLGRRCLCYDRKALDSRKENKPGGNAVEMAAAIGALLIASGIIFLSHDDTASFLGCSLVLCAVLVGSCRTKGEPPRWP